MEISLWNFFYVGMALSQMKFWERFGSYFECQKKLKKKKKILNFQMSHFQFILSDFGFLVEITPKSNNDWIFIKYIM